MKTLACFLATWITATALLLWLATRHDTQQIDFAGAQITLSSHHHLAGEFWHSLTPDVAIIDVKTKAA